jgi:hypothetical protein
LAAGRCVEEAEDGEEGRLSAPGGTTDGYVFSLANLEMDLVERMGLHLIGVEDLGDPIELDERIAAVTG